MSLLLLLNKLLSTTIQLKEMNMLKTKDDLHNYLQEDHNKRFQEKSIREYFAQRSLWKFNLYLRKTEYHINNTGLYHFAASLYYKMRLKSISLKLGWMVPPNTCGAGLCIVHPGTVIINNKAHIGKNARIHACVNIGASKGGAPTIADNVYIGPGAKIYGNITIGDNVTIGANAVVNKDFGNDLLLVGIPAKVKG